MDGHIEGLETDAEVCVKYKIVGYGHPSGEVDLCAEDEMHEIKESIFEVCGVHIEEAVQQRMEVVLVFRDHRQNLSTDPNVRILNDAAHFNSIHLDDAFLCLVLPEDKGNIMPADSLSLGDLNVDKVKTFS